MSPLTWLLAVGLLASASAYCPNGYTRYAPSGSVGYCYKYFNQQKKNWQAAEEVCKSEGGHLAGCRNDAHNTFVGNLIGTAGTAGAWIGINDRDYEGQYEYADISNGYHQITWSHWGPGFPNDQYDSRDQDCVETNYDVKGDWNDVDCLEYRYWVCEY